MTGQRPLPHSQASMLFLIHMLSLTFTLSQISFSLPQPHARGLQVEGRPEGVAP